MTSQNQSGVTIGIWFSAAIMCFSIAIYGAETGHDVGKIFLIPMLFSLLATLLIWVIPAVAEIQARQDALGKAKHQPLDRAALLLELMDEDEQAAFKSALKQRVLGDLHQAGDGELPLSAEVLAALAGEETAG